MTTDFTLEAPEPQSPTSSSSGTAIASAPSSAGRILPDEYTHGELEELSDPKDDPNCPLQGYPELAKQIVDYPDFEAFQSFKDLSVKSLLYYQAELDEIRTDLHELEWTDFRTEHGKLYCVRADSLLRGARSDNERAKKQFALITRMRKVMKDYHEELLRYSQISALPQADTFNVNSLHKWISLQGSDKRVQGPGAKSWGDLGKEVSPRTESFTCRIWRLIRSPLWVPKEEKPKFDLIVPRAGTKVDGLARWVANEFVPFWQYLKDHGWNQAPVDEERGSDKLKKRESQGSLIKRKRTCGVFPRSQLKNPASNTADFDTPTINSYRQGSMLRFTSFIATIVACLLPTVAIAVLAQLHTIGELLGIIAVFTAVFASGLMMLVDSGTSRVEIFTATAAFSAVMVVFVQNQNGGAYNPGGASLAVNGTHV